VASVNGSVLPHVAGWTGIPFIRGSQTPPHTSALDRDAVKRSRQGVAVNLNDSVQLDAELALGRKLTPDTDEVNCRAGIKTGL
jgi:hypothetical protein